MDAIITETYERHNAITECTCPSCNITRNIAKMDDMLARTRELIERSEMLTAR